MNKYMRILLVLALLVGFVAFAGSQAAWAVKPAAAPAAGASSMANSVSGSTVNPPSGCGSDVPVDLGATTLCGVATVASDNGELIGTSHLANRPEGFKNKMVVVTLFNEGTYGQLCFAARKGGAVYFQNPVTMLWSPIFTVVENGLACASIFQSGNYVLGPVPAP